MPKKKSASERMNEAIRAGGLSRHVRGRPGNTMNDAIRRAAGRLPQTTDTDEDLEEDE